jgi:hypothetical protein
VGGYLLLRVEPPDGASASVVAFDDGPVTQLDVTPQRITAVGHVAQASTAIIRVNAFPGWRATVNGHAAQTVTDGDGYMRVALPAGDVRLTLTYGTTRVVWLGRALVALGLALLLALTLPATVARRARYRLSRLAHGLRPRRVDGGQHA